MATTNNSTDQGELVHVSGNVKGQGVSSPSHGYQTGGTNPGPSAHNVIGKYPFSAPGNAADVGDLTQSRYGLGNCMY